MIPAKRTNTKPIAELPPNALCHTHPQPRLHFLLQELPLSELDFSFLNIARTAQSYIKA
jgi:hypothetical protein